MCAASGTARPAACRVRHTGIRGRVSGGISEHASGHEGRALHGRHVGVADRAVSRDRPHGQALSLATRRQRENIFGTCLGDGRQSSRFAKITTATIMAGRDRRAKTPFQARHFLDAMRGLFRWAVKAKLVKVDPTVGVDDPPRPKTDGFPSWTEEDVAAYEKRWPIGTRQRVWLDVLLYTGLRRGDAVRLRSSARPQRRRAPSRRRRPAPKSRCRSCRCSPRPWQRDRAAI